MNRRKCKIWEGWSIQTQRKSWRPCSGISVIFSSWMKSQ